MDTWQLPVDCLGKKNLRGTRRSFVSCEGRDQAKLNPIAHRSALELVLFTTALVVQIRSLNCQTEELQEGSSAPGTSFCCKNIDWTGGWCHSADCLGFGCSNDTSEVCPTLNQCLCNGRINYKSKSACAVTKACNEADEDYQRAQKRIQDLMGQPMTAIPGCEPAILGVICAYHFPRCTDDGIDFPDICYSTCLNMYDTCVPPNTNPCPPGSNWTEVDTRGEPYLDADGEVITTACPGTTGRRRTIGEFMDIVFSRGAADEEDAAVHADREHQDVGRRSQHLRGVVAGGYYENEPGKIKLSDFAAVGSKCRTCLTVAEIASGDECTITSQQFTDANLDCTAASKRLTTAAFVTIVLPAISVWLILHR